MFKDSNTIFKFCSVLIVTLCCNSSFAKESSTDTKLTEIERVYKLFDAIKHNDYKSFYDAKFYPYTAQSFCEDRIETSSKDRSNLISNCIKEEYDFNDTTKSHFKHVQIFKWSQKNNLFPKSATYSILDNHVTSYPKTTYFARFKYKAKNDCFISNGIHAKEALFFVEIDQINSEKEPYTSIIRNVDLKEIISKFD